MTPWNLDLGIGERFVYIGERSLMAERGESGWHVIRFFSKFPRRLCQSRSGLGPSMFDQD